MKDSLKNLSNIMEHKNDKEQVLVSGGGGFLASNIILKLLQLGYRVKTTLRDLSKQDEVIKMLERGGLSDFSNLGFIEADLTNDRNWDSAVEGCRYVLHVASPFPAKQPDDENEVIIPARDGALRVLRAARNAGVKRVVLTSSFVAVGQSIQDSNYVITEKDWTDLSTHQPAYVKSKTLAEKAAWDFIATEGGNMELAVINPVGIFGPALGKDYSVTINMVRNILMGNITKSPNYSFPVVDVRDVVDIQIKAMTNPKANGERFIASSDGAVTFYDMATTIKKGFGEYSGKIADMKPNDASVYIKQSNQKARTILGWQPRSAEEALLATAKSIVELENMEKNN